MNLSNENCIAIELPLFLDNYIFTKLGARFAPNFEKFNKNLHHSTEDILIYLGTYFPRSFVETYSIFNDLFQNTFLQSSFKIKSEINILDIGSGTGGDLTGILLSMIENLSSDINFNITVVDGNQDALKILEKIIFKLQIVFNLKINLSVYYLTFKTITELYEKSKNSLLNEKFDFIISSKMINEIIIVDNNAYFNYLSYFTDFLSENGLLSILDVTIKIDNLDYIPILLNEQSNQFIQTNLEKYKTLSPLCCINHEENCNVKCFTSETFCVTHSKKTNDRSKVSYRIIGRKNYISSILSIIS